jgi:hypothetical protein
MSQVQCPNCGGFRASRRTRFNYGCYGCALPLFLIAGLLMCWGTGDVLLSGDLNQLSIPSIFAGVAFILAAVLAAIVISISNWNYSRTHYKCLLCGYRWEQLAGQPAPEIHVRPDLIEMGTKRLKEEEEARRREEEEGRKRQEDKKRKELEKLLKEPSKEAKDMANEVVKKR